MKARLKGINMRIAIFFALLALFTANVSNAVALEQTPAPDRIKTLSISGGNNFEDFNVEAYNLDSLLDLVNDAEALKAVTEEKIDLLSSFRNGDDVVVPLGFFLYLNKKF